MLTFTKFPGAILAFLAGVAFILAALVFEGMRPAWHGNIGYDWPMGLLLGAGICTEVAAMFLWASEYVPASVGK